MYDEFDSSVRRLIADAEADIGFDRDVPRTHRPGSYHSVREVLDFWTTPAIAVMRAMWWPNRRT
ncbi:hypothetical protein [Roseivivax isoporae]|uniref:Uncharacterized protein n=1 Tax=Roseivivax isoporae LMG 25204 TaxID=1449351 RepID=X7F788_9RHOB|nr:hypothetical protein [Roseivivax isoporae]ETX28553.1 hypothetical protein RISW2_06270 [Roseivivax isoporae LMG 25204]